MPPEPTTSASTSVSTVSVQPPRGWRGYLRALGPGLLVAMAWIGTGDLIDSSVSGANYGYNLMWALALALITKYFYAGALAKYQLCNAYGDESIFDGFRRLWRWYPLILGVGAFLVGFILQTYILKALGTSLFYLSGELGGPEWGVFLWSSVAVLLTLAITLSRRHEYKILEVMAKITALVLVVVFVGSAIVRGVDAPALLEGLVYSLPPDKGIFGSLLVAVALLGAIGSSIGTLLYPQFIRDKGWRGPQFLKVQRLDLLVGMVATAIIDLAIWAVAASTIGGTHATIGGPDDLVGMMVRAVGGIGPILLWVGVLCVTVSSFPAYGRVYTALLLEGTTRALRPAGTAHKRSAGEQTASGRGARFLQYGVLYILPLAFSLPSLPNMVVLTVAGSSMSGLLAPLVIVGAIILTGRKKTMSSGYANKWWENVILILILAIALWASWGIVKSTIGLAANM